MRRQETGLDPKVMALIKKYDKKRESLRVSKVFTFSDTEAVMKSPRQDMLQELLLEAYQRNTILPEKRIVEALTYNPVFWNSTYQQNILNAQEEIILFAEENYLPLVSYLYQELMQLCGEWERHSHAPLDVIYAGIQMIQPGRNLCYFPAINPEVWTDPQLQRAAIASDEYFFDQWAYTRIYQLAVHSPHVSFYLGDEADVMTRANTNDERLLYSFIALDWKDNKTGKWLVTNDMLMSYYRQLDKGGKMALVVPTQFFKQNEWLAFRRLLWKDRTVTQVLSLPAQIRWNDENLTWHVIVIEKTRQKYIQYLDATYFNYLTQSPYFDLIDFLNYSLIQDNRSRNLEFILKYEEEHEGRIDALNADGALPLYRIGMFVGEQSVALTDVVKSSTKKCVIPNTRQGKLITGSYLNMGRSLIPIDEKQVLDHPLHYIEYQPIDEPCVIVCMNDYGVRVGYVETVTQRLWAPLYAMVLVPNEKITVKELARQMIEPSTVDQILATYMPQFAHMTKLTISADIYLPMEEGFIPEPILHE